MFFLKKLLDPDSDSMNSQGFKPNFLIKILRFLSKTIIFLLSLNGRSRWSNEFIQSLNPSIKIKIPSFNNRDKESTIWFRTGHGRLYWRTRHSFDIEPEIVFNLSMLNIDIVEIPINYNPRSKKDGKKMSINGGIETLKALLKFAIK